MLNENMFLRNFLLYYFASLLTFSSPAVVNDGLYSHSDDVVILSDENFAENVYSVQNAWIIEFYNSWCGHCRRFAPVWKSVATDVKGWSGVIKVGAIDCSTTGNLDICRNYKIKGYPTMRLLPPYASKNESGVEFHNQDPKALIEKMVDFVTEFNGMATSIWPNLQPLESLEHIWGEAKDHHKHVALVFEEEDSYTGREVILDMSGYKDVLLRRALKPLMVKFGINYFPSLYLLDANGMYKQLAEKGTTRDQFREALLSIRGGQVPEEDIDKEDHLIEESQDKDEEEKLKVTTRVGVYMQDLESTLTYLLRQEVAIQHDMKEDSVKALKKFLHILAKYFPGREHVKGYLWRIHTWLVTVGEELSGQDWLQRINSFQTPETYLSERIRWIGCAGSQLQFRGYPCGLWTLFHTLTVNAQRTESNDVNFNPRSVLDAIAGYIKHFFGCSDCAQHFLKMAESIDSEVKNLNDSVLWLWQKHNLANDRLKNDFSTDPRHPKIQFPSLEMCKLCHKMSSSQQNMDWNTPAVLNFLIDFYSKNKIISIEDDSDGSKTENLVSERNINNLDWWERQQRKKDIEKIWDLRESKKKTKKQNLRSGFQSNRKRVKVYEKYDLNESLVSEKTIKSSFGFSHIDLGMCVVFYIMCTVIVFIMYYHFAVKRCRFSMKLPR
ncbi:sulfhydryl oxidase 2-like [Ylistrum balloti]|uniref:sulfhydryl oxidase 2-like n=1 Tax=Ylistrum balloti TaxID=509963 RepID=UPI002905A0E8|nr:sulfhydryl oxidase 2-like [Ylistrum balloti]